MVDDQTWGDDQNPLPTDETGLDEGENLTPELDDLDLYGDNGLDIDDADNPENW